MLRHGTWSVECESLAWLLPNFPFTTAFEPGRLRGKGRGKELKNKKKLGSRKEKACSIEDKGPSPREGKGKDSWSNNSCWRPWFSENWKRPLTRDEGGKGRCTLLRNAMIRWTWVGRSRHNGFRGGPTGPLGGVQPPTQTFFVRRPTPNERLPAKDAQRGTHATRRDTGTV